MSDADADVVMFAMDRQLDRRIVLAAEGLMAAGLSVRLFAPADGAPSNEASWVSRIGGSGAQKPGLALYRMLRDRVPVAGRLMRRAIWSATGRPEQSFLALFADVVSRANAPLYVAHDLPMLPVALAARQAHGGKVLFDSHELYSEQEFSEAERVLWRQTEARFVPQADAVITVNPSIADELARRYGIAGPVVVSNAEAYRPEAPERSGRLRAALGWGDSVPLLLFQGGITAHRNIATLIRAIGKLRRTDICLALLGDGPAKGEVERLVSSLGLGERVRFHAAVPQADLPSMTADADLGVIPYQANCLNTYYCTPNKLYEFIMARLPVVASDLPELRRAVEGNGIGVVGDTTSPATFAALIDAGFDAWEARRDALKSALDTAARSMNWEVEGQKYLSVVRSLLPDGLPTR